VFHGSLLLGIGRGLSVGYRVRFALAQGHPRGVHVSCDRQTDKQMDSIIA